MRARILTLIMLFSIHEDVNENWPPLDTGFYEA